MNTKLSLIANLALLAVVITGVGCSTFSRDWKSAASTPPPASDISGRWEGTWHSEATGHKGRLRCIVTPLTPDTYRFFYDATFKRILHGRYTITQSVERVNGRFTMRGGAELPKIYGGRFDYEGVATPTEMKSTYRSKKDRGTFEMTRPTE